MSTHNPMVSVKNNFRQLRKISYFKEKGKLLKGDMRTGKAISKFSVDKDSYALSQERKKLMFKKGTKTALILILYFAIMTCLSVFLLS